MMFIKSCISITSVNQITMQQTCTYAIALVYSMSNPAISLKNRDDMFPRQMPSRIAARKARFCIA